MENKKLLEYLLKDLSELDEMFAENGKVGFDELEMEFIKSRVSGAKRLVKLFLEQETVIHADEKSDSRLQQKVEKKESELIKEVQESEKEVEIQQNEAVKTVNNIPENVPEVIVRESIQENKVEETISELEEEVVEDVAVEEKVQVVENNIAAPKVTTVEEVVVKEEVAEISVKTDNLKQNGGQEELHLDDEEPIDIKNKRLGDSFSKEKSVNDLMSADLSKLEHKLSNRPVSSLKAAIGINDKFQYIRELFEGSADDFVKTVGDLDSMNDLKEAVDYLQDNFKWKKSETSLKFVNLIKRRFLHE